MKINSESTFFSIFKTITEIQIFISKFLLLLVIRTPIKSFVKVTFGLHDPKTNKSFLLGITLYDLPAKEGSEFINGEVTRQPWHYLISTTMALQSF